VSDDRAATKRTHAVADAIKALRQKPGILSDAPEDLLRASILGWIEMPREEKPPRKKPRAETPDEASEHLGELRAAIVNLRSACETLEMTSIEQLDAAKRRLDLHWPPNDGAWRYHPFVPRHRHRLSPPQKPRRSAKGDTDLPTFNPSLLVVLDEICPGIDRAIGEAQNACKRLTAGAAPWQDWRSATAGMLVEIYVRLTGEQPGPSKSSGAFFYFVKAIFEAAGDHTNPGRYARDAAQRLGRITTK
jgi:hypothetical protein